MESKPEYMISNILIEFGDCKQTVNVEMLHDSLYKGLSAENYHKLYNMMVWKMLGVEIDE